MLGELSGRQEENITICAFQWRSSVVGITVVKRILILLDLDAEH